MPADVTWRHRRDRLGLLLRVGLEQQENRAAGVGDHGEAPDIGNIRGPAPDRSARGLDAPGVRVDVVGRHIAGPAGWHALLAHWRGDRHQPRHHDGPLAEDRVGAAVRHLMLLRGPADHVAVEHGCGPGVGGHHVVPEEGIGHVLFLIPYSAALTG